MPSLAEMLAKSRAEKEKKANGNIRSDQKETGAATSGNASEIRDSGRSGNNGLAKPTTGILGNLAKNRASNPQANSPKNNDAPKSEPAKSANGPVVGNSILAGFGKLNGAKTSAIPAGNSAATSTTQSPQIETPVKVAPKVTEKITVPQEVPDDQKIAVEELTNQLNYLIENIDDKDLIGPVIRNILAKLQASPELCVFVPYQGMNQIVRGIRASFKFEALKSDEKRDKKAKTSEKVSKIAAAFADAGFNIG